MTGARATRGLFFLRRICRLGGLSESPFDARFPALGPETAASSRGAGAPSVRVICFPHDNRLRKEPGLKLRPVSAHLGRSAKRAARAHVSFLFGTPHVVGFAAGRTWAPQ